MPLVDTPSTKLALSPPTPPLVLKFKSASITVSTPGGPRLTRKDTAESPVFYLPVALADPAKTYFVEALDLDAPFPSFPFLGPINHGLWHDVKVSESQSDEEGYVILGVEGKDITFWGPPGPPPGSGPHRYLLMVWEQPEGLTKKGVKESLGMTEDQAFGIKDRMRFDQVGFEKKNGLGTPISGTYFTV